MSELTVTTDRTKGYKNLKPFSPGVSGNPKGRPKGSRNKLSERFLKDLRVAWKEHGKQVLDKVAEKEPAKLLTAMVAVLPKDFQVSVSNENQGKWVIDARPMSVDEWQKNVLLHDTGNKPAIESTAYKDKVQMSSKAGASDVDCAMVDAGYLVDSD